MSNVTSQSELTTKEIVEQAISDYHATILPYLAKGNNGYSETPIGAMQMFDDTTAPSGWLVADGTIYDIDDYPFLANHFERVHGSKNYYGGNGTTTFAVPDWQGEFFRASGTNSHTNQGSGGNVGVHQDATEHLQTHIQTSDEALVSVNRNITESSQQAANMDFAGIVPANAPNTSANYYAIDRNFAPAGWSIPGYYTSRPTNTSLLCCIKAVPAGINYSLEEQEVGTWIDGKSIYRKTWAFDNEINLPSNTWVMIDSSATYIDKNIFSIGNNNGGQYVPIYTAVNNGVKALQTRTLDVNLEYVTLWYTKTTD